VEGEATVAGAAADDLIELLATAKLTVPDARRGAVSRIDLIERARDSDARVVAVSAPAGYGKTTLLSEWAHLEDRRTAWVSLDRYDDDPAALLRLLAGAFGRVDPSRAYLVAVMGGVGSSLLGRVAPRLASAFSSSPHPFALFIDDLHELQNSACHDVLEIIASRVPAGSQLVVASRNEQPHLTRLRTSGQATELGMRDLALDAAATRQIFAGLNVSVTDELASGFTERTEGWAAGLYLAALIAREQDQAEPMLHGDDRYVTDYLYRESFATYADDMQVFLRRSAVLEQMSGPLCDAVLESTDSSIRLRLLEGSNAFLVPLDRRRGWYRYHGLFREFLLGELHRTEPGVAEKLHERAADWYESQNSPEQALEHLLGTSQHSRAVQLAASLVLSTYHAGRMSTIERWLDALSGAAIKQYPPLALLAGWVAVLTGDAANAERWGAFAEAAAFDVVPLDGTESYDSGRAMLRAAMAAGGVESVLEDATFAVAHERPGSPWRDTALLELASAELMLGRVDDAHDHLVEAAAAAAAWHNLQNLVYCESELAVIAMDLGQWDDGAGHLDVAMTTIESNGLQDYPLSLLAFVGAGRLALRRGDVAAARRHATHAMRARTTATYVIPFVSVRLRVQLAKLHLAMSDATTARHLLREIDDILLHRPALGRLVDEVNELRARASAASADTSSASPLTPAEVRLLPYLQTHLTFQQIGERLFVSRHTVASEVHAIYRKFGVSSRDDAVRRATELGLLGG
jgi:LuxR family maltose regulon positive regulatory protein